MIKLRDYQKDIADKACKALKVNRFVYLAMEVRTGKTLTSLSIADYMNVSSVLFVTKKKAISSIQSDFILLGAEYEMVVINYESIHKLPSVSWDMIILDEAHGMGLSLSLVSELSRFES